MFYTLLGTAYFLAGICAQSPESKRGLVYIPSSDPSDVNLYTRTGSDISFYYNYGYQPTTGMKLPFVPMLHNLPNPNDKSFLTTLYSLLNSSDPPTHLLTFNEPDMATSVGGSDISPTDAAQYYIQHILPLRRRLQISLPSTSGSEIGSDWLRKFNTSCHKINPPSGCPADFIATHFYGDFAGLASWLGQIHALYPSLPIWITEFAEPDSTLTATQNFFNQSLPYLDNLTYLAHYVWFGTFRANTANSFVGPNVSFLDDGGQLTDLGSWYLGGEATGHLPFDRAAGLQRPVLLQTFLSTLLSLVVLYLV